MAAANIFYDLDTNSTDNGMAKYQAMLNEMPLMSSPWPMLAIVSAYLYFVLRAGPKMMENRKPYNLRILLALYNLFLVAASSYGVVYYLSLDGVLSGGGFVNAHCKPASLPHETKVLLTRGGWIYFISKLVELLDTVFFILRKKTNQVSFLHVYHHTNLAVLTWVFIKTIPAPQNMIIAVTNSFIHSIMYGYYFLSALGPWIQPYLWWKKYLTRLQIMQFVFIMSFMTYLVLSPGCNVPRYMITFGIGNTSTFLVLFLFFYAKAYTKKSKAQ